jgi:hypothetical protein
MEPLPTIGKAFYLLVQQERHVILPLDESKILAVAQYSPSYGRSSSSRGREDMGDRS